MLADPDFTPASSTPPVRPFTKSESQVTSLVRLQLISTSENFSRQDVSPLSGHRKQVLTETILGQGDEHQAIALGARTSTIIGN